MNTPRLPMPVRIAIGAAVTIVGAITIAGGWLIERLYGEGRPR